LLYFGRGQSSLGIPTRENPTQQAPNQNKTMKHTRLTITIASAVAFATAPFAAAVPTLYFDFGDDGTIDATSIDEVIGSDTFIGIAGVVNRFYIVGDFFGSATGATKPSLGTETAPELAETTLNLTGKGKIAIYFSEDGYGPTNQGYQTELSISTLASNATVNYYTYATTAAFAPFVGAGTPMTSQQLTSLGASSASGSLSFNGSDPLNVPFTLTQ
jgi:hypothetical protein